LHDEVNRKCIWFVQFDFPFSVRSRAFTPALQRSAVQVRPFKAGVNALPHFFGNEKAVEKFFPTAFFILQRRLPRRRLRRMGAPPADVEK